MAAREVVAHYPDGQVREINRWIGRELEGKQESYYPNGTLRLISYYHNGHRDGIMKSYFENGNLNEEIHYRNGLQNGPHLKYSNRGNMISEKYYVNGDEVTRDDWLRDNSMRRNAAIRARYGIRRPNQDVSGTQTSLSAAVEEREVDLSNYINPLSKCKEKNDNIVSGEPLDAKTVIIFSPFSKNDESECYGYDSWKDYLTAENEKGVFIWERGLGALKYAPVFKLPYSGVWVQSTYNLLTRFNTFVLKSIGTRLIGSQFGVSNLHGASEHVYIAIPVNRSEAMRVPDVTSIDDTIFIPQKEDYIKQSNYKPDTIVQISRGGTFAEMNRRTGEFYRYYLQTPGQSCKK